MRAWLAAAFAACVSLSPDASADDDSTQNAYETDPRERSFRVGFDPGSRVLLGAGYAPHVRAGADDNSGPDDNSGSDDNSGAFESNAYLEAAIHQRHRVDFPDDGVSWKLDHRILGTRLVLSPDRGVHLTSTAYDGQFMRWSRDGQIFFPPAAEVPFPLDIGFATMLGQLDYRQLDAATSVDIGVLRSEIVLGMLRLRTLRTHLRLGVGPSYGLRLAAVAPASKLEVSHIVAPFTGGSIRAHHESADGLHAVDLVARASYALRVDTGWALSVDARLRYELVLVAVNDLPVSTYLEAGYAHAGDPPWGHGEHDLSTTAGMRFSIPVDTIARSERAGAP